MSPDPASHLIAALQRTQLLAPEQMDEVARELLPHCPAAEALGEQLVSIDWLTPFQLRHLLAGEWAELVLGPYQLLDTLGEGGLSQVYRAWDTLHGRVVALKVLHPDHAARPEAVREFLHEAEAVARLSHPNIIKAFGAGRDGGREYYAMECVEGADLGCLVQQGGPLPVDHACDYTRQAAQGLQAAHQAGLVHRDIKPANLFLANPPLPPAKPTQAGPQKARPDPSVKIIDWGLARSPGEAGDTPVQNGQLLGTADYMAPEQIEDASLVDIRADIYSLGCTVYFLLTGQPPFPGTSVMQKILQHREAAPPSLRHARPDVPDELDGLAQRMLAKRPADRPQIPLMLLTPLRRLALAAAGLKPQLRAGPAPGTAINMSRPATLTALQRPSTLVNVPRPIRGG